MDAGVPGIGTMIYANLRKNAGIGLIFHTFSAKESTFAGLSWRFVTLSWLLLMHIAMIKISSCNFDHAPGHVPDMIFLKFMREKFG